MEGGHETRHCTPFQVFLLVYTVGSFVVLGTYGGGMGSGRLPSADPDQDTGPTRMTAKWGAAPCPSHTSHAGNL